MARVNEQHGFNCERCGYIVNQHCICDQCGWHHIWKCSVCNSTNDSLTYKCSCESERVYTSTYPDRIERDQMDTYYWKCVSCNNNNGLGLFKCSLCNVDITSYDQYEIIRTRDWKCASCNSDNTTACKYCYECGNIHTRTCLRCNKFISHRYCDNCGESCHGIRSELIQVPYDCAITHMHDGESYCKYCGIHIHAIIGNINNTIINILNNINNGMLNHHILTEDQEDQHVMQQVMQQSFDEYKPKLNPLSIAHINRLPMFNMYDTYYIVLNRLFVDHVTKLILEYLPRVSECSICMDDVSIYDIQIKLPCKHYFHSECAKNWLKLNNTCPICTASV
jgi:hypothetical protein